jgi:Holliday junction resolvase RusA-like endonuclease
LKDWFHHAKYVSEVVEDLRLTSAEIENIHKKYQEYAKDVYVIPITIWATPTPYSPLRINHATNILYVPNKAKLVKEIRNLILKEVGVVNFQSMFFPRYQETILKSALYLPTPKSFSRENTYLAEMKLLKPIVTPDLDNVEKIVNDAIKAFIIYDDAQIVTNVTEKFWSKKPRMEVEIVYNSTPLNGVHEKIIKQRKEKWEELMKSEKPPAIVPLMHKFLDTSKKHTKNG